jgi:hypothetical protein
LTKGDLGGIENLQEARIYGKRYKTVFLKNFFPVNEDSGKNTFVILSAAKDLAFA